MDFFTSENFITFNLFMNAYTNEKNEIKKCISSLPKKWQDMEQSNTNDMVYMRDIGMVKHNGIGILTKNLSVIDIDEPKKCNILNKLLNDCKIIVQTRKGYHFYFNKENQLPRQKCCKIADINTNLLYFTPQYFHTETGNEYNYKLIKNESLGDMPEYAINWCQTLISMSEYITPPQKSEQTDNVKTVINPTLRIRRIPIKAVYKIIQILYNNNFFEQYSNWRDTAYILRHLNNSEKVFLMFDKYSRLIEKYKDEPEYKNRLQFFGKGEYNENFNENGVLLKIRKLDPTNFKKIIPLLYKSKYDSIKFNQQFIYNEPEIFNNWVSEYKILCIKSAYGTGKTYAFKQVLEKHKFRKVLFITYRQSLAISLTNDLTEKFGFKSYLDKTTNIMTQDKLIIQLDSLKRMTYKLDSKESLLDEVYIKYDLIVLDEIEGLLNHLSFNKINQTQIYNILVKLINNSTKVLCLDGDLSDRSMDFISNITKSYVLYNNVYKPVKKDFRMTHNLDKFNKAIDDDLKAGKKIVIVSMTKTDTERLNIEYNINIDEIYKKYKNEYKICIHNSIEKNKDIMADVNNEWLKYDMILYSPTIESGVDFNIPNYFDRCYGIINNNSTTYRAFNQMLNRVRYYKNNDVLLLMPTNMQYITDEILYRFEEIKATKYNNILGDNGLNNILIHNDTERINSTNYFMTAFIKSLDDKGHSYKYLFDKPTEKMHNDINDREIQIECICKSKNLNVNEYEELCNRRERNDEITRKENYEVIKYFYSSVFKTDIKNINEEWLDERYNKVSMISKYNKINMNQELRHIKEGDYNNLFELKKINEVSKIINIIGYAVNNNNIIENIEGRNFEEAETELIKIFSNKDFKILFNKNRDMKNNNICLVVNDLLDEYGYKLDKKRIRKMTNGINKNSYEYNLTHNNIIIEYNKMTHIIEEKANDRNNKYKLNALFLDI